MVGVIGVAIILRVLVFGVYTIPTPSMEPSIMAGDRVVVNKLIPGPLIVRNILSLNKGEKPTYKRLLGYRKVKRNDVLIFNFPYTDHRNLELDMEVYYAKRCVAVPGDTFYIENGIYKVKGVSDTLGYYKNQRILSEKKGLNFDPVIYNCFPYNERYSWNMKNFGPLYLPKENETLTIDTSNILFYRNLIRYETKKPVTIEDGRVYIGDRIVNKYTFKKNYYFMAGDLIFDSNDSRYWGLLPEDHIIGKVSFVYKSTDKYLGKTRWDRFLKTVD